CVAGAADAAPADEISAAAVTTAAAAAPVRRTVRCCPDGIWDMALLPLGSWNLPRTGKPPKRNGLSEISNAVRYSDRSTLSRRMPCVNGRSPRVGRMCPDLRSAGRLRQPGERPQREQVGVDSEAGDRPGRHLGDHGGVPEPL